MRISNKVGGKEGRVDEGQTARICELCSNSVICKHKLTEGRQQERERGAQVSESAK